MTDDPEIRCPASYLQESWYRAHRSIQSSHNLPLIIEVTGCADPDVLVRTLHLLADRHEILRTSFAARDDQVCQVVRNAADVTFWSADLSRSGSPWDELLHLAAPHWQAGFSLSAGSPWRAGVVKLAERRHVVVLTLHHVLADAWSTAIVARDFERICRSLTAACDATLPPMEIQFGDYASWERALSADDFDERYFEALRSCGVKQQRLPNWADDGFEMVPQPAPAVRPDAVSQLYRAFSGSDWILASSVLTAVSATLYPYLGGAILIGFVSANRARPELLPLVGPVFNYVTLPCELRAGATVGEAVGLARREVARASHLQVPLGLVERSLGADQATIFDVTVNVMKAHQDGRQAMPPPADDPTFRVRPFPLSAWSLTGDGRRFAATSGLNFNVNMNPDGSLSPGIRYNSQLVGTDLAVRLGVSFSRALELVATSPQCGVSELLDHLIEPK
ncbi:MULTISPECIES: condensation domain-containing protein [Amycolatopsis]|uniref:Condensation domain-containing protein n=1 Tax=Amycolatopsis thermalba TaxID=944492 RepID=A0ABY4P0N5_9PSEU|nr:MULTISPECIES: condensation domain-containing protein [Amycolatopsis]UQS25916.1 condensation domain-containing protein [Amycolatopsis thermalba]